MAHYSWTDREILQLRDLARSAGLELGSGGGGGGSADVGSFWNVLDDVPNGPLIDPANGNYQVIQLSVPQTAGAFNVGAPSAMVVNNTGAPERQGAQQELYLMLFASGNARAINGPVNWITATPTSEAWDGLVVVRLTSALGQWLAEWVNPPAFDPHTYAGDVSGYGSALVSFGNVWSNGLSYKKGALVYDGGSWWIALAPPLDNTVKPSVDTSGYWVPFGRSLTPMPQPYALGDSPDATSQGVYWPGRDINAARMPANFHHLEVVGFTPPTAGGEAFTVQVPADPSQVGPVTEIGPCTLLAGTTLESVQTTTNFSLQAATGPLVQDTVFKGLLPDDTTVGVVALPDLVRGEANGQHLAGGAFLTTDSDPTEPTDESSRSICMAVNVSPAGDRGYVLVFNIYAGMYVGYFIYKVTADGPQLVSIVDTLGDSGSPIVSVLASEGILLVDPATNVGTSFTLLTDVQAEDVGVQLGLLTTDGVGQFIPYDPEQSGIYPAVLGTTAFGSLSGPGRIQIPPVFGHVAAVAGIPYANDGTPGPPTDGTVISPATGGGGTNPVS